MIVLTTTTEQTLAPGQSITFDNVVSKSGRGECFRMGSSGVQLCAGKATYEAEYGANIGGTVTATPVQLSLNIGSSPLPGTTGISTPAAVGDLNNVSRDTYVRTCCNGGESISVTNTGTSTVVVGAGASLAVGRRS